MATPDHTADVAQTTSSDANLKDNWPALAEEVRRFFDTAPATEGDHGRIEVRRALVSHDTGWLRSDRRFPDEGRFPGPAKIGMVEATVECGRKTTVSRRYCLSSAKLSAPAFAAAVRARRGIENRLRPR